VRGDQKIPELFEKLQKKEEALEKIVIVTSQPKPNVGLLASLNTLFPDCEIQIVFREVETSEQCQADSFSGPFTTDTTRRA